MCRTVICNLSVSTTLPHYLINGTIFEKKMRVLTFSTILSETLLTLSKIERDVVQYIYIYICIYIYIGICVKYHLFCQILVKIRISCQIFQRIFKCQIL